MQQTLAILLVCLGLCAPGAARAGPWLRDPGKAFVSLSATPRTDWTLETGVVTEYGLYAEYGWSEAVTLGLDANDNGEAGHALAFLRLPLRQGPWPAAIELGIGAHRYLDEIGPMARLLFSGGHGFSIGQAKGWSTLTMGPEWRQGNSGPAFKFDGSAGIDLTPKIMPMIGIETYLGPNGDFYWTLIPGLAIGTAQRRWTFGYERRGGGTNTHGIRMGLWLNF